MSSTQRDLKLLMLAAIFTACGTTAPKSNTPTVTFVNPVANQALTAASGTVNGSILALTVSATTSATTGSPATVSVDGKQQGSSQNVSATSALTFPGVELSGSATGTTHKITVTVTDLTSALAGTASVTVTVTLNGSGGAPTVTFVNPVNGQALTASSGTVSGSTLTLGVSATTNAASGSPATLAVDNVAQGGSQDVTATGQLAFSGIALTGSTAGTSHTLTITLTDLNTTLSGTASVTVTVTLGGSTGACTVTISPATNTVFNETGNAVTGHSVVADESTTQSGMQAKIVVSVGSPCTDGEAVTLTVGGTALAPATLANGTAVFDMTTLPDSPVSAFEGTTSAELTVIANAGTGATANSATVNYLVDSVVPTLDITSPLNNATIAAGIDAGIPGLQIQVLGTSTGLADWVAAGAPIPVSILGNGAALATPEGAGAISLDGGFAVAVSLPNGQEILTASAQTPSGNLATSNSVTVTGAAIPVINIVTPANGATINSTFGLVDGGVLIPIKMTTTAAGGSAVTVCSTVPNGNGATSCPASAAGVVAPYFVGSGTANGAHTVLNAVLGDDQANQSQTLTAFVSDGTETAFSQVTVFVHIQIPVIESVGVDSAFNGGGLLWWNASNLDAGGATAGIVTVTLSSSDTFVLADGGASTVLLTSNGSPVGSALVSLVGTTPTANIPLTLPGTTAAYDLLASVSDVWGNPSSATQTSPVAPDVDLYVKTSSPTCAITPPVSGTYFNVADNGGTAAAGNVLVPVSFAVTNSNGVNLSGAPIDGNANVTVNGTVAGSAGTATPSFSVAALSPQGADTFAGNVTDPAGNPATPCASFALNVDTVTPTVTVAMNPDPVTPSSVDGGVQIYTTTRNLTGTVTTGPTLPVGTQVTVSVNGFAPVLVTVAAGGGLSGGNGGAFTISDAPNGTDAVFATATDVAGNVGTGSSPVIVNVAGCDLALTSPTEMPLTGGGEEVLFNSATPTVIFHSSCTNTAVGLVVTPSGTPAPANTDGSGNVSFALAGFTDQESGTLTATVTGGVTLGPIEFFVKLSKPSLGTVSPAVSSFVVVAYQDNPYAGTDGGPAAAGGIVLPNGEASTTSAYATFSATGIAGLGPLNNGNNIGTATLSLGGATLASQPIASGATSVTFTNVALPPNNYPAGGSVVLTLTDNAGNSIQNSWLVVTDVVSPTAPTVTAAMQDKHAAAVQLSWTVPAAGSGTAIAGYEDHYLVTNLGLPTPATVSDQAYADGGWIVDSSISSLGGGTANGPLTHAVTGLPTLNQYSFEVRSIDAVGNRSLVAAPASTTSVAQGVTNAWQQLTIVGPDAVSENGSDFGYLLRSGKFTTGDFRDLVITTPNDYAATPIPGAVYILYGTGGYGSINGSVWPNSSLAQIQVGTVATGADNFGYAAAVGDFNGDGVDDLAVGAPAWNNGQGRVDIFFGSATGLCGGVTPCSTPSVTMFGDSSNQGLFGHGVSAIGDINGDKIQDLLIGAPAEGAGGTAYLFLGTKSWPATPVPATTITSPYLGDGLGARWGSVPLGDVNGDGTPDFSVSAPGGGADGGPGNEYFVSGAIALANPTMTIDTSPLAPLLTFPSESCSSEFNYSSGFYGCFGFNAIGGVSFTGGTQPDLLVSDDQYAGEFLYPMAKAGAGTVVFGATAGNQQGWALDSTDINGDGKPDMIAGINDNVGDTNYVAGAFIYLNTGGGLTGPATAIIPPNLAPSTNPSGDYFGYAVLANDLQAQGSPDIVISDVYPLGKITIFY